MSVREHFTDFAPDGEARILPPEGHQSVCLGMLDAYDIVIQHCQWLSKGFSNASFLKYEGIAECNSIDRLTSVFYGSSPSVLFVVVYKDYDQVMVHIKRIMADLPTLGSTGLILFQGSAVQNCGFWRGLIPYLATCQCPVKKSSSPTGK